MTIKETIKQDLKEAMKAKEEPRLTVLRGILSAFTNELVSAGKTPQDEIDDDMALAVIKRAAKQRKDAIAQFEAGGRPELAESEQAELAIIDTYLPQTMSAEQIRPIVEQKMSELGISEKKDIGRLMGAVMAETKGQADGNDVKAVAEALLS
jgi:uncharacterized protein